MTVMSASSICNASLLLLLAGTQAFGAVPVQDDELGVRLTLPDNFERLPEQENRKDLVRVYRQAVPGEQFATIVAIERLHGVIPRVDLEKARANQQAEMTTERWRSFDILVGRVAEVLNGVPAITLNAQVPLKPEAVQLKVIGPASRESQLRALLRDTLNTLEGSTNWLTAEERTQRLSEGAVRLGTTIAVIAMVAVVVVLVVRRVLKRAAI